MVDIDNFKRINDTSGHLLGDRVIRDVAEILKRSVRLFDICTRFGGDEFAVVMPGTGSEDAMRIAERIRERIASYRPVDAELDHPPITVSLGLAVSTPDMTAREQLISDADQALYLAKAAGKNCVKAKV